MNIEWIGTGSGLNPVLGNTSFLVRGDNRVLLVDCGATVPIELIKKGYIKDVTDVLVTHIHGDHVFGLEGLGFMHYFAFKNRDSKRVNLHIPSDAMAHRLWEHSLRGSMENIQTDDNQPQNATLETFFNVAVNKTVSVPGVPTISFVPTRHVFNLEGYGLRFENGVFYSGDTIDTPPHDPRIIFHDCQFYKTSSDVHVFYEDLRAALPADVRAKTHLVHLDGGYKKRDAKSDGFAGYVMPGDIFNL